MFTKKLFSVLLFLGTALANVATANVYDVNTIANIDGLNTKVPPRVVKNFDLGQRVYVLVTIKNLAVESSPKRLMVKWYRCDDLIRERDLELNALPTAGQQSEVSHVWFWLNPESYGSAHYKADIYADEVKVGSASFSVVGSNGYVNSCNSYVILNEKALFDFGGSELKMTRLNTGVGSADELVALLHKRFSTVRRIEVIGYADEIEVSSKGTDLSLNRAEAVKSLLVSRGIHADRVSTNGLAGTGAIVTCSAELSLSQRVACLAPNRRVELRIDGELR